MTFYQNRELLLKKEIYIQKVIIWLHQNVTYYISKDNLKSTINWLINHVKTHDHLVK